MQLQKRHAVLLHAAGTGKPIGSDGCVGVDIFSMQNIFHILRKSQIN